MKFCTFYVKQLFKERLISVSHFSFFSSHVYLFGCDSNFKHIATGLEVGKKMQAYVVNISNCRRHWKYSRHNTCRQLLQKRGQAEIGDTINRTITLSTQSDTTVSKYPAAEREKIWSRYQSFKHCVAKLIYSTSPTSYYQSFKPCVAKLIYSTSSESVKIPCSYTDLNMITKQSPFSLTIPLFT